MSIAGRYILTLVCWVSQWCSAGQHFYFSARQSTLIYDSIDQSRWDIGGALSLYRKMKMIPDEVIADIFKAISSNKQEALVNTVG